MATVTEMRSVPGIVESRDPKQTARILGTGVEVWEVVRTFIEVGHDAERLQRAYHWLSEAQLAAALEYAREHRPAITARLEEHYRFLPPTELAPSLDF
jgi:uncharacterized protein (DUF433 family)